MSRRVTFLFPLLVLGLGCASARQSVPEAWSSVPVAAAIRSVELDTAGTVKTSPEPRAPRLSDGQIQVVTGEGGARIANGLKMITAPFPRIDSVDLSEEREEVVFSAERDGDFDVALVATDGSAMNWMPDDPSDEVMVQWAPRGNKISLIIRAPGGDVVRTLHIPTAFQFAIPFENATIHDLAWDAEGARYAVAYSTPLSSDAVDVLAYDGTPRTRTVAPASTLDVELEPFAREAFVLRPRAIRYEEKLPVVIWLDDRGGWNDARAALLREARVAVVVAGTDTTALREKIAATAWMDASRVYRVGGPSTITAGETIIVADAALAPASWSRQGGVVTVAPAVIQSFAARFIASDLERTSPPHGSSR